VLSNIRGIKVAYPAFGADLKGLLKSAFLDPNPVVVLEHKGLYWSKVPGTEAAKTPEPDADYLLPFGKGRVVREATSDGARICVVTYGRGIHWALEAADTIGNQVEVVDLRTIQPWDEALVMERVSLCNRCLVLTEEPAGGFASAVAGKISSECFSSLDAPVRVLGSMPLPAIPLNSTLEAAVLPSAEKVADALRDLLAY
jgi:2-oxoisovalerate dehydrogenase E1 component